MTAPPLQRDRVLSSVLRPLSSVLAAEDLGKRYGDVWAVWRLSLAVTAGEVLAVLGDNGAGKTTLIAMLSGALAPDSGRVLLDGEPVGSAAARAARARAVAVVRQDLMLAGNLDAGTNVFLGEEPRRRLVGPLAILDDRTMREQAQDLLAGLGVPLSRAELARPVRDLSGGQRQAVAIARALRRRPRFLLLDEPASALAAGPRQALERVLRERAAQGVGVLVASQSLEDALGVADRAIVLRKGRLVGEGLAASFDPEAILRLMEGVGGAWTRRPNRD